MGIRKRGAKAGGLGRSAAAASWFAIVAATTLGDDADALRAEIRAPGLSDGSVYRLVVQSYDSGAKELPGRHARPVGSLQRSFTARELRRGVHVSLVQIRPQTPRNADAGDPLMVAWIEAGAPDLEFDGRMARPRPGSVYGLARRSARQGIVHINLDRTVTA
jgi:hypothetical protein